LTGAGIAAVSIATPLMSADIFNKWFTLPWIALLAPIPIATTVLFFAVDRALRRLPVRLQQKNEYGIWVPFACTVGIFLLSFYGLAYSLFPYLVMNQLTIWQAAASPVSLKVILIGALIVLPAIIGYTIYSYRVFWGKATALRYD
jgi:cytochrome d ubiquinol oxidase subunit II